MSLRVRLFLLLGCLVFLLVSAQWWLVRALTRDLSSELGQVVMYVGHHLVTSLPDVEVLEDDDRTAPVALDVSIHEAEPGEGEHVHEETVAPRREREAPVYVVRKKMEQARRSEGDEAVVVTETEEEIQKEVRFIHKTSGTTRHYRLHLDASAPDTQSAGNIKIVGPESIDTIPIPRAGLNSRLDRFSRNLFLGTFGLLGLGLVLAGAVAYRVTTPLKDLGHAARTVGTGALGAQVPERVGGEVGEAIRSFNRMSRHLKELDDDARALRERRHLSELGEVARGMAHSMRNPLNALGLSIEELAEKMPETSKQQENLESVRRQIRRMDQSIRSFLMLASEGAGQEEELDVTSLAQDVVLEVLQDSRGKVRMEVERTELTATLVAVGPELRAVFHALAVNAVEASPEGGRIKIRVSPGSQKKVRVEIEDEGSGFPQEVRESLFTPHVTTKANGTGMGIFVAHRIVTSRYIGSLDFFDIEPQGTRAVLELSDRTSINHA
jgi:signal transduction histidine kinase